jgi:thiol-disulfide isomerase/thioredoxin
MVDCSTRGTHEDVKQRYNVTGFPTAIFLNSDGEEVERLGGRSPDQVRSQIARIVEQYGAPTLPAMSIEDALEMAREEGKLVAAVFSDSTDERNTMVLMEMLGSEQVEHQDRFVWILRPINDGRDRTEEAEELRIRRTPTLLILDPSAEGEDQVVDKITSFRRLANELEKALEAVAERGE